jgi:hypothetical protein
MKTTQGKTKAPKQGERVVKIYGVDSRRITAQFNATSLRAALKEFFERNLEPKGWKAGKYVGNTLQVIKGDNVRVYRALELYQEP